MKRQAWGVAILLVLAGGFGKAQVGSEEKCDQLWAKRDNLALAEAAAGCYTDLARANPKSEETWVKAALAGYYLGELIPLSEKEARLKAYGDGKSAALQAIKLNPQSLGGHFWAVVLNGRVTEIKGIFSGSFDFGMCIKSMTQVASMDVRYYHGGVYRFWGRFVHEIPSLGRRIARFTLQDSIELYQKSLEIEPNFFMTRLYMAEAYLEDNRREPARKELEWVVSHSPDVIPEIAPENRLYQRQARELLAKEFGGK